MRCRPARRLHRFSPRTAAVLTCVGAALCGATPVHGEVMPGGPQPGVMVEHAPVRGQSPTPNRNAAAMPASAGVLAGEPGLGGAEGDYVHVISPTGTVVSGEVSARESGDTTLLTAPLSGNARGWYLVHWNVVSSDGHPMGGDDGAWWAFGHRGSTVPVKKPTTIRLAPVTSGAPPLTGTMNGMRTGMRTITLSKVQGTVYAARWTLQGSLDGATNPQFSWDVSTNRAKKTATLSGIVPRTGTYTVSVLVKTTTTSGTTLTEYVMSTKVSA